MNTHDIDIELPSLPEWLGWPVTVYEMTAADIKEAMQDYAREAIEADRKRRGNSNECEPVAWHTEDHLTDKSATTYDPVVAERWIEKGWPVSPLFRAPQPAKPVAKESLTDTEPVRSLPELFVTKGGIPFEDKNEGIRQFKEACMAAADLEAKRAASSAEPVAYLDLGVGGYMDVGTALTDEQLAALPKGRHMLGIIGTYGVNGYREAAPQPAEPVNGPSNEGILSRAFIEKERYDKLC